MRSFHPYNPACKPHGGDFIQKNINLLTLYAPGMGREEIDWEVRGLLTAFLLGFGAGIAATPHCLGMCGAFPLHLSKSTATGPPALRQLVFVLGKTVTYVFLGTVAAALGVVVFKDTSLSQGAPFMRFAAGGVTIIIGLVMAGARIPFKRKASKKQAKAADASSGLLGGIFGALLTRPGPASALVLGLAVGFLPCPLPMGMMAAAAVSRNILYAMALMAGVGLGTAPGLIAIGLFGMSIDKRFRNVGMRAAGVLVICAGLITIFRASGIALPSKAGVTKPPACCGGERVPK